MKENNSIKPIGTSFCDRIGGSEDGSLTPGQYLIENANRMKVAAQSVTGVEVIFSNPGEKLVTLSGHEITVNDGYVGVTITYDKRESLTSFWNKDNELKEQAKQ